MPTTSTPSDHPKSPTSAVIGVLGGIASGKSEVARQLAAEAGVVIDADALARAELNSPRVTALLRARFGEEILGPDGLPDRVRLGERVFQDPAARRELEGWIHPAVRARIAGELSTARAAGRSPIVLDVPLLLENDGQHGLVGECDFLVFVEADAGLRDRRAAERRGWPSGEVARREQAQLPLSEKRARARHIISNEAGLGELTARVQALLASEGL
jgi:dephospho-CoA kinase